MLKLYILVNYNEEVHVISNRLNDEVALVSGSPSVIGPTNAKRFISGGPSMTLPTEDDKRAAAESGENAMSAIRFIPGISTPPIVDVPPDLVKTEETRSQDPLMGRLDGLEKIVDMAVCLTGDESSQSVGSEFVVDGGYTDR